MNGAPLAYLTGSCARANTVVPLTWFVLIVSIVVCVVIGALLWMALRRGRGLAGGADTRSIAVERGGDGLSWIRWGLAISAVPLVITLIWTMAALGHVVGSASDRTRGNQTEAWESHGVDVAFVGGKHHLHEVREAIAADRYLHIGDTSVDSYYARLAGFDFVLVEELTADDLHPEVLLGWPSA